MRRWKREWETRKQYQVEDEWMNEYSIMLHRILDYTAIGGTTGALVVAGHLLQTTLLETLLLACITFVITVSGLVFCEKTEEQRLAFVIKHILRQEGRKTEVTPKRGPLG